MGQKLKISATITSIILLSGMLGFGFSPDALARHDPNAVGKGLATGCDNKGVAKNNPHCDTSEPLPTVEDSPCNDGDGEITVLELLAVPATNQQVTDALGGADLNNSISIDTAEELAILITFPPFEGC